MILALAHAGQSAAQDSAALPELASAYLSEVIDAARAQASAAGTAGAPEIPELLAGDPRWVAPQAQPGIGPLIGHFAVHGTETAHISGVQLAGEAARVTAKVSYAELPDIDWPVTLDFLWLDGEWKIREVEPARRRALPADASPDEVLVAYLSDLKAAVERHSGLPPQSWLAQALQSRWIAGGGGYWRRAADCPRKRRADCMAAPLQGAGLWTALAQDRAVDARINDFRLHPQRPSGEVTVTTARRTYTAVDVFAATLERDKRHGWQITSLKRRQDTPAPAAINLEVETGSGLALVTSLLDALTGPGAPSQAELLADPGQVARYFADSREGRKAAARTMNLPLMLSAMGTDAASRTIAAEGPDRVRVDFATDRGGARSLLFSLVSTGDGPKIGEVLME
ncbi:hypothetical protein METH_17185 [Leisingera methylohalidivorans DSM 14336]|uniref:Uncharacterized protein n=1 Tax=Leisingera methylohalidivorans DSM 14336 TaxID=999552 RepID=V9VWU5_9RHOB|nr:hypothetical protein METH_17185 [Leisingera methylohalidivorans DSM 14336]